MNKALDQIIRELKIPFNDHEIEFKVGPINQDKTMGLALAYVKARAIQNRLDHVIGFNNWKTSYREVQGGFLCSLSLRISGEWISKEDGAPITDYESIKGGISGSFKRVASSGFGIGRYLYEFESQWYPIRKKGRSYEFTVNPNLSRSANTKVQKINQKNDSEDHHDKLQRAKLMKITFGKHNGKTLWDIYECDNSYFKYLATQAREEGLVNACKYLELKYGKN